MRYPTVHPRVSAYLHIHEHQSQFVSWSKWNLRLSTQQLSASILLESVKSYSSIHNYVMLCMTVLGFVCACFNDHWNMFTLKPLLKLTVLLEILTQIFSQEIIDLLKWIVKYWMRFSLKKDARVMLVAAFLLSHFYYYCILFHLPLWTCIFLHLINGKVF